MAAPTFLYGQLLDKLEFERLNLMYNILFIDLDDTILDFKKAENVALRKTLEEFGLAPTEEVCARYSVINQLHWEMLERKEITREQVLLGRFKMLFDEYGIPGDSSLVARRYTENLGVGHYFLPGAEEAVKALCKKYRLFITSNGTTHVQKSRLASADIEKYFEDIFISQQIGVNKPDKVFFDGCFAKIRDFDSQKAMIVGDSLTSDILGGKNAGIATCWVNPKGKKARADICPDYEIKSLGELEALLEGLN